MKNRALLFLIILFSITFFKTYSQELNDSIKLKERNDAFINYENYRSSITDTTLEILKKLNRFQTDLIISDNEIIHNYISTNTSKVTDLQKSISVLKSEKDKIDKKYEEGKKWMVYGIVGVAIFIILAILFFILFVITNKKKNSTLNQLIKIEKIKEEQLKEISLLKNDLESHPVANINEFQKKAESLESDIKIYKSKYDTLLNEKVLLENKLREKEKAFNEIHDKQIQLKNGNSEDIENLRNNYENQIIQLKDEVKQLKQSSQFLDGNIQDEETISIKHKNEINELNNQLSECKDLIEIEKKQRQELEEKSLNLNTAITEQLNKAEKEKKLLIDEKIKLENEFYSLKQELESIQQQNLEMTNIQQENTKVPNSDSSELIQENNMLKTEVDKYKAQLQKENQLRIEIENEIKQIIEEIKGTRNRE